MEKKNKSITFRFNTRTYHRLASISEVNNTTKTSILERLIDEEYQKNAKYESYFYKNFLKNSNA